MTTTSGEVRGSTGDTAAVDVSRHSSARSTLGLTQDCSCGGLIVAASHDWRSIEFAVRVHHDSLLHLRWRWDGGMAA